MYGTTVKNIQLIYNYCGLQTKWAHHLLKMKDTCSPKLKYEHILTNRRKHKLAMKKIRDQHSRRRHKPEMAIFSAAAAENKPDL